jgi:small GTP-binding protein
MQSVKVVVTGPFNAGKTTFIKAVSEITVLSTERQISDTSAEGSGETTVAMDFGRITVSDDVVLYLFGTPGQSRFSFMWETLSEGMLGFVLIVDAMEPQTFEDARGMISFFTEMSDVPFVVAANKVDADDVVQLQQVRSDLGLDEGVPLLSVDARSRDSVKAVLLGLLYEILESMDT